MTSEWTHAVTSEGLTVAEVDLADADPVSVIREARQRGVARLWVHTNIDLTRLGFARRPGYARLRADHPPEGAALPRLHPDDYARTLDGAYRGVWGHKHVAESAEAPADATVLGLYTGSEPIGLCRVFVDDRLVDGPGVIAAARAPANYARLLSGACSLLGPGPVDLESWGDPDEIHIAYINLGFSVIEQIDGWELSL